MGIHFGPQMLMSNSSKAMQAGEFAKAHGAYEAYHDAVFNAFFTQCKDIGDMSVILEIAQTVGLDSKQLEKELSAGIYHSILKETTHQARSNMVSSVPTFHIEGGGTITGAQPIAQFRAVLKNLSQEEIKI